MKRIITFLSIFAMLATPSFAASKKPLVVSSSGQMQQIQVGDTIDPQFVLARSIQTGPRTIYVRTDGNDGCTGAVDAAYSTGVTACSKATWQGATDTAFAIDNGGYDITIQAGSESGVKTWNLTSVNVLGPMVGKGRIHYTGNGANTVINASSNGFYVTGPIQVFFGNLKIISGGAYGSIVAGNGAGIFFDSIGPIFGNATGAHIMVHDNQSYIAALNSTYTIAGTAGQGHIWAANNGTAAFEGDTVTITGNPNLTQYAQASTGGYIQFSASDTWTGTATGYRFYAQSAGQIATANQGISFLPGSVAGVATSGGLYLDTNTYGFGGANFSGTIKIGGNAHQIYDNGVNYLQIALANTGSISAYTGFTRDSTTGMPMLDGPGGSVGLSSAGTLQAYVSASGLQMAGALSLKVLAAASLPTCGAGAKGQIYAVNDATSATFNATVAGGGVNNVMAFCNGTNWTVH